MGWVSIFDHDEVWRRRGPEWWESGVERGVIGATDQPSRHTAEIDDQGKDPNLKKSQIQIGTFHTEQGGAPSLAELLFRSPGSDFPTEPKPLVMDFRTQECVAHANFMGYLVYVEI